MNSRSNLYIVEKILEKKIEEGTEKYKIKWEGYSKKDCTWEGLENLESVMNLVEKFNNKHKENKESKPKRAKGRPRKEVKSLLPLISSPERLPSNTDSENTAMNTEEPKRKYSIFSFDLPERILKINKDEKGEIFFLVQWKPRRDGEKVQDSMLANETMRNYFPQLLLDFYESRVKNK